MLPDLGEWQTLVSKPIPSGKPEENPALFSQTKDKCSEFLLPFKGPSFGNNRQPLSGHPGGSAFLPASWEPVCGVGATIGQVASTARRSCKRTGRYVCAVGKMASLPSPGCMLFSCVGRTRCFLSPNFCTLQDRSPTNSFFSPG